MDCRWSTVLMILLAIEALRAPAAQAAPKIDPAPRTDASSDLDDRPEPLVPKHKTTPAEQDRIEALALFAAGRAEEQQGDTAAALRLYQRALRLEPDSLPIVREVIAAAQKLERIKEVVNYTIRALELDPSDARLPLIAERLAEQGEVRSALKLYEKARELQTDHKSPTYLNLTLHYGELQYRLNHPTQAAAALAEVVEALENPDIKLSAKERHALEGNDGQHYQLFGQVFLAADRADDAMQAFERMQELAPDPPIYAFNRAQVLAHKQQAAPAIELLREYLNSDETPATAAPYELLAKLLKELGRESELLGDLKRLLADDPDNQTLKLFLAEAYLNADKPADAAPLFVELQKKTPSLEGYRGLVSAYLALDDASKLVGVLAEIHEKTAGLELVSSQVAQLAGDEIALDHLTKAVRELPASASTTARYQARVVAGLVALEAKRYELASEFFESAIQAKPRAREVWLEWGLGLLRAERYADAADVFRRAIDSHVLAADNPAFHTYLAIALAMDDKTDEALATAREAAEIGEHAPRLESRVPWVLYHAKRYDEALAAYVALIDQCKDSSDQSDDARAVLREARLALSNICVLLDRIPEAEEWLEQVLDEHPDDTSALNDLGYLWADQGKHLERALRMIQQAVDAEPENAAYRDSLGWAFYRLGRPAEAVEQLEKATAGEDPDGVILDHLGDAYAANKQTSKARETWRRAVAKLKKEGEKEKAAKVREKIRKN